MCTLAQGDYQANQVLIRHYLLNFILRSNICMCSCFSCLSVDSKLVPVQINEEESSLFPT